MLLGTANNNDKLPPDESLVIQLMLQQRYAQVYELLTKQEPRQPSALYNMALCLHWGGNYQAALSRLESIQLATHIGNDNKLNGNSDYNAITTKQNQTNDYLHGMSEPYIKNFPELANDAIIRLKADCWLKLGNFAKVIAIATPIANKGYQDITDALQLANTANDKRI
jgi:tetratricopeptide (TPR) repeat protein